MSELSQKAFKRNGSLGRVKAQIKVLKGIKNNGIFIKEEIQDLEIAIKKLERVYRQKEKSWGVWKKRNDYK